MLPVADYRVTGSFRPSDDDIALYAIPGFQHFINDFMPHSARTPSGTAIYVKYDVLCGSKPLRCSYSHVEMTLSK